MSESPKTPSNWSTIRFMVILCMICSGTLSLLNTGLKEKQNAAQELDRNKQLLMAAHLYHPEGYFEILEDGVYYPAKMTPEGALVKGLKTDKASDKEISLLSNTRIKPIVINDLGEVTSFEKANIAYDEYIQKHRKEGYAHLPMKLAYAVLPNGASSSSNVNPEAYIIPINGRALWDAVYGYLAIQDDGNTVIGTTWYKHAETPGLGANIATPAWQSQFANKVIFQPDNQDKTDFKTAPIGITVVKGKAHEVYANSPKEKAAVDGMAGATLTGNGVMQAYKSSLAPYRSFFIKLNLDHSEKVGK